MILVTHKALPALADPGDRLARHKVSLVDWSKRSNVRHTGWSMARRCRPAWLALALLCGCCLPARGISAPARHGAKQERATLALRHYALSSCLRQAFPEIADEADAAKDGYLQNGSHPAEAYQAIQSMAAEWLQRPYASFRDVKLTIMKCIDFAESAEVGSLARRTMPRER